MGSELSVCIHTLVEKKEKKILITVCAKNKNVKRKIFDWGGMRGQAKMKGICAKVILNEPSKQILTDFYLVLEGLSHLISVFQNKGYKWTFTTAQTIQTFSLNNFFKK